MTVQLPSGNGVFPPRQRWDDNRDITGHQVPPAGCVLARKSLVASVVGDVPATTKQKHPGEGMEYCHGLRAGGLHLWQDEIQKSELPL